MTQGTGATDGAAVLAEKKRKLEEKRKELEAKRMLAAELFDRSADGVSILKADGTSLANETSVKIFGATEGTEWMQWAFHELETGNRITAQDLGAVKAMSGQAAAGYEEIKIVAPALSEPVYIASHYGPIPGGGAITVFRDIGSRVRTEQELKDKQEKLAKANEDHKMLIGRLRGALEELATPVLRVARGVLVIPLIGVLDSQRAASVGERLLAEIVQEKASYVVVDVTGVEMLDTSTADHLARIARSVSLLGATCMLSGVQPEVAQTLVALGIKLGALAPHRNLERALEACRRMEQRRGYGDGRVAEVSEEEER